MTLRREEKQRAAPAFEETQGNTRRSPPLRWDRLGALAVLPVLAVPMVLLIPILFLAQGRPLFHASLRVGEGGRPFRMWKFRTMHPALADETVLGSDPDKRVTPLGHWLRRSRLDELPQILNLLRGDIAFIGVRPPFPKHVAMAPDAFAGLLNRPPGVTGLGTLYLCAREERWLAAAASPEEVDDLYVTLCLRRKLRFDRFFQQRQTPGLTALVLIGTVLRGPRVERGLRRLRRMLPLQAHRTITPAGRQRPAKAPEMPATTACEAAPASSL